jgi:predicted helicase
LAHTTTEALLIWAIPDKEGLAERKLTLDDDYIKFLRFGEWRIEETGHGVLAYVTNDSYAHGIVHRRMRERIAGTFDKAHVLELHGDTLAPRSAPGGVADQNVFDIRPGVAVSMFLRKAHRDATPRLMHAEIWGQRHHKYEWLEQHDIADTPWQELPLRSPWFFFVPKNLDAQSEWDECVSVPRLFLSGASAIQTKRDELFIDIDRDELAERMRSVLGPQDDGRKAFAGLLMPTTGWAPDSLQDAVFSESAIAKVNYRPFDLRFIYYDPALLGRARFETQRHMLSPNVGLLVQRRIVGDAPHHFLCARSLCDLHTLGTAHSNAYLYPLYLYDSPRTDGGLVRRAMPRRPNLNAGIIGMFESQLGLSFVPDRHGDTIADGTLEFGPEDVLNYVYAMLHCPTYRQRYSEFLKINFPRVPITGDVERFRLLCALGGELVSIHLLEHPAIDSSPVKLDPAGSNEVGNVRYDEKGSRVYINAVQYFAPVEAEVYAFRVGAYQPLNKWLKDRKARRLSYDDIAHYSRMAFALRETIRLMEEIDRATPEWPVR